MFSPFRRRRGEAGAQLDHLRRSPRGGASRRWRRSCLAVLSLLCLITPSTIFAARPVPGRILLELTDAGARELHRGTLQVPLPAGGEALDPRLRPLFVSREGALARFALLTFNAAATSSPESENARWIDSLLGAASVVRAESDQLMDLAALPDDPYLTGVGGVPAQFHLHNPSGLSLRADRAWPFVPAGAGVVVGVIDTGVLWRHDDLGGPVPLDSEVLWTNAAEVDGVEGIDDDGNGYVDDFVGWDWVEIDEIEGSVSVLGGEDAHVADNDPSDYAGHGTFVAGMVTANTGNGVGLAGAPEGAIRIMPLRVGWGQTSGQVVYLSFCSQAVEYAMLNGADVINCSWNSISGFGLAAALDAAINDHGVVVVGSAGNGNTTSTDIQYLASREDCIGVASVDNTGTRSSFSNYGSWVDIAGFGGRSIFGAPSLTFSRLDLSSGYGTNFNGGTSFAAPQIAGQAALLRAVAPDLTPAEVRALIVNTGQDLSLLEPTYASRLGGGIADFAAAIQAAGGGWDRACRALGLTPLPGGRLAVQTDSTLGVVRAGTGEESAPCSGGPGLQRSGLVPALADFGLPGGPVVLHDDGDRVLATDAGGGAGLGWPVTLSRSPRSIAAAPLGGGGVDLAVIADGAQLQVYSGPGLKVAFTSFSGSGFALGDLDSGAGLEAAGVDASGVLRVLHMQGEPTPAWSAIVGPVSLPPVVGEFDGPGIGSVVLAAPDTTAGSTRQRVHAWRSGLPRGGFPLDLEVPGLSALSLAGFSDGQRLEIVLADSSGGIHVVSMDGPPTVRTVQAGGPIAGEVLCADVNGDWQADLVALRTDGTLLAWNANLEPLAGFPRHFPYPAAQAPVIVDDGPRRYVAVADEADGLWSIPLGPAGTPAPWPTLRGDASRRGALGFETATPLTPTVSLRWEDPDHGRLCWTGIGLDRFSRLRIHERAMNQVRWEGEARAEGCAGIDSPSREMLVFEGLDRLGGWTPLGSIVPPSRLRLLGVSPNPFADAVEIRYGLDAGPAELGIFDVRGRLVHRETLDPGSDRILWIPSGGGSAPAGIYFLRLEQGGETRTLRLVRLHR